MVLNLRRYKGQQLGEYSLAIALIAVALITACAFFGSSASDAIGSMVSNMNESPPGAATGPDPGQLTLQTGNNSGASPIAGINANDSLMTYANNLNSSIETSGANGTTTEILALLNNYINQSSASGKLTPEQANELHALTKQGYELASIEAVIEDMAKNDPGALNRPYTHNGTTYNKAVDLAIKIGFDPSRQVNETELQRFVNLYNKALSSGTLNDPEANHVVTTLTNQIVNIANGVEGAAVYVQQNGRVPSPDFVNETIIVGLMERDKSLGINTQGQLDAVMIQQLGGAGTTIVKSDQICATGGKSCEKAAAKK